MIMNFNTIYDQLINETLEWKDIPPEEQEQAENLINAHNTNTDPSIGGYYAIDVTGKYSVYYTLWRIKEFIPGMQGMFSTMYMGNLSTELLSAVKKAIDKVPSHVRIELAGDKVMQGLIGKNKKLPTHFKFGKYRGETFSDVYFKDPNYFMWLANNADPNYSHTPMYQVIQYFGNLAQEEVIKKNQAESLSEFVGTVGGRFEGEITVYNVKCYENTYGYGKTQVNCVFSAQDVNGNKLKVNNLQKSFPKIQKGDKVEIRGLIKDHKELMGIKFTKITNVRSL